MIDSVSKLKGKRVLLLTVFFFDYQNIICDKLRALGAEVVLYDERSVSKAFERALLKVEPYIFRKRTKRYYEKILNNHKGEFFDYILIIKCDMLDEKELVKIKNAFPMAKMCLHVWDSIQNIPHILDKVSFFDYATSFDRMDCQNHPEFKFRPLFYSNDFIKNEATSDFLYDVSFCGTIHSERYKIIKQIKKQCEKDGKKYYGFHYLQNRLVYNFYKITKKEFRNTTYKDFDFEKKSSREIADIVKFSKTVVDIQHPKQIGLTMRTIEMLGMKKKLITTNQDIVNYDFYDARNIFVIDSKKPVIDMEFISKEYYDIDVEVYEKYSLEHWIYDVLGI